MAVPMKMQTSSSSNSQSTEIQSLKAATIALRDEVEEAHKLLGEVITGIANYGVAVIIYQSQLNHYPPLHDEIEAGYKHLEDNLRESIPSDSVFERVWKADLMGRTSIQTESLVKRMRLDRRHFEMEMVSLKSAASQSIQSH